MKGAITMGNGGPDTFEEVFESLQQMQRSQEVDAKILGPLSLLRKQFSTFEEYWLKHKDKDKANSFAMYHASRNAVLVLDAMEKRFREAKEMHDNPVVADDAISVVPKLARLYTILSSAKSTDYSGARIALRYNRELRNFAKEKRMLPSQEEQEENINNKKLNTELGRLAKSVREIVSEK